MLAHCCIDDICLPTIVNILFMAPRMVYCNIINLLWSLKSKLSTEATHVTPVREQSP